MVFDSQTFDLAPYADFAHLPAHVRRTYCSWHDASWRSLLVQTFEHATEAEDVALPGVSDLHLVLCVAGDAVMRTHADENSMRRWVPGTLELMVPGRASVVGYRGASAMRTVQVHIPSATIDRAAAQAGRSRPDFEALAARLRTGDALVEQLVRALPGVEPDNDLYAESAAAFLVTHLLTEGKRDRPAGPEHAAVRAATAIMRDRLAESLTLSDIAAELHLSVFHFIRVFRAATGETPHRYLTRLRIEHARRLLSGTTLTIEQVAVRCGFASPGALSTTFLRHVGVRPSVYRSRN